jgi:hypothetical protein
MLLVAREEDNGHTAAAKFALEGKPVIQLELDRRMQCCSVALGAESALSIRVRTRLFEIVAEKAADPQKRLIEDLAIHDSSASLARPKIGCVSVAEQKDSSPSSGAVTVVLATCWLRSFETARHH